MEDGVYLAVPYDVHVLFRLSNPGWSDTACVHAPYSRKYMENGLKCEVFGASS